MAVTDDEILKFRERFQQKQAERMRTMAELPETAADDPETQGLAEKLNVAPDVIASDPQAFANKAKTSQYDWEKIAKDNPALTELLQDPNHAKSALRSMGALESVESNLAGYPYAKTLEIANREARIADRGPIDYLGNVADDVKKNWEIGQLNSELADIGSRDMFGEATEDDRLRATELETRLAELAALEFDLGYVGEVPGAMAESLPLMIDIMLGSTEYAAAGAGAGVVTGGAIGTVVPGAGTVGGALTGAGIGARAGWTTGTVMESAKLEAGLMFNDFKKMTDENGDLIDQDVARGGAMIAGLMAGGLEAVSLDVLLKQIPGADRVLTGMGKEQLRYAMKQPRVRDALANFGKRIATGMTVEGITEGAQEAINVLAEWSIAAVAEGDFETTTGEEALSRIGHATYRGSQGGVGFSTMTGTAGIVNDVRKMRQANNRKAALTAISESSKEARDKITPKQYRSFVENVVETHGAVDQVYVSKDQLQTFFQDSGIDETVVQDRMPDVFDQLKGDEDLVSIKMEDFVEYMSHLDTFDSLADHIKFDPMDMTPAEAIQYKAELQTILKEYETVSNIQEKAAETDRPVMSAMYDYLMSTGMPSDQAMPQAAVWEARYRTRADALGVDAFELFKSENVTVTRETAGNVPKMDRIDALLNMLREGKGPTEKEIFGSSITEYIIGKGGIKDEGGEAAARDWDRAQPEFGGRRIAREEGMPVDQALESAIEAGFFPGKDLGELTADDLYTMIEQDLSGERVYAPGTEDVQALALRDELANLEGMLEAAGIDNLEGIENQTVQDMLYTYEQAAGGKNAITGDLNKVNPAAREAAIESLDAMDADDRLRMTANLDMLKGTPWAAAAVKGLVYRTMLNRALRGEDIRNLEVNEVWGKQDMGKTEIIRTIKSGDQRLIKKMIGNYDFIGNNRKAEQDISTSFSNCDPSKACAAFCYAAKGNARPNEIAKSEFTEWALENYTDLVAEEIAGSYGRSMPAQDGLALRLNDKGDLSKAQVKLVKKLNDRGIRMQIFSKRPELLRKLSDFNLRMLSIDDTNFQMALDNPDLNIAFTITEATTEKMLEAVNDRVRVYLPVTMTGKHMTRQQVKELYPNLFGEMTTKLCPVDAGKLKTAPGTNYVNVTQGKEKGLWTCTSCDLTGCAGCFHGENTTANVRKVQFTSNISTEKRDTLTDKSIQEHKDAAQTLFDAGLIDNEQFNTILTAIDQGSSTVWSDADARTEGAGDKEFTDGLSAQEQNRAGDPETAGQVVTSGEVDLDVNGRQIRFTMPKRAQGTDTMVLIDTDKVEREWRKSEGFYVGEQGKNGIGKRYQNLKKSFAETDTMNTPELGFMDNGFPMFTDGRHRFAVMRDMGMNVIPVALDPASLQIAIKHGYVQTETYNQDIIQGQQGSATTQVATTTGSYTKAAKKVLELKPDAEYVLDYGAGLGLGTDAIRKEIPAAESYEPFPERWKGERPVTYSNSNEIPATYDAVINLNVLNVLEPELRDQVATDIISKLAPGGVAVIGTRKWKGDVDGAKNFDPAEEEHAIWVKRKQGGKEVRVYQRGFDGNELVEYMTDIAGPGFTVKKGSGIAASTVYVTRNADADIETFEQRDLAGTTVVNEDGTPKRVYRGEHGSGEMQTRMTTPTFTDAPGVASVYAMEANDYRDVPEAPRVYPVYLDIKNPAVLVDYNDLDEAAKRNDDVVSLKRLYELFGDTPETRAAINAVTASWREDGDIIAEVSGSKFPDTPGDTIDAISPDAYTDTFRIANSVEMTELAKSQGYDGFAYVGSFPGGKDELAELGLDTTAAGEFSSKEYRPFSNEQIVSSTAGVEYRQGARGYITTNANRDFMAITLTGNANLSTFIHESGHAFLFQLLKDAEKENAPQQMKDDAAIVRSWWSENAESIAKEAGVTVDDVNAWLADDFNGKPSDAQAINTAVNEQFARGFEAYVREGKAPSAELRPAFARFKAWMTWIYRTLKRLNVNLSDDIRGVMDRMLASDQEIRAAADQISFEMIFTDQDVKDGLLTQEEFDKFNAEHMKALDAAKQEVEQTLLRTLRRERDQEYRKRYNKYFEQYLAEVFQRQDIRARYLLINGKLPGEDETPLELQNVHLSKDGIEDLLPGQANKFTGLYRVEGGIHPDFLAPKLGYDSGMALLNDMLAKPKWNDEAKKLTDARMAEEFPDPMKDGTVSEEAIQEIHDTNGVGQFLHMELKALSKKAGRPAPSMQVLREAAATRISEMEIMSINPNKYMMAEQSAARKADKAKADGDFALATDMKRRQLLNHAMYREAMKAREKVDKNLSRLKSFEQKSYQARLMKAGQEYRDAVNALLEMIDLRKVSNMEARRRQLLMTARDAVNSNEDLEADLEDIPAKSWKSYTPDELQALRDEIEYIYKQARDLYNIIIDGEKMDFDVLRGDLIGSIHENATVKPEQDRLAISKAKTLGEWLEWGAAIHAKPEFMFRQLDGNKAGIWWKVFMPTLQHAEDRRATMLETYGNRMREILKPLRRTFQEKIEVPGKDIRITKETIFSMALNYGNEDNRRKLYEGQEKDGWSQRMVDDIVMNNMTKEDWDAVQAIWDMIEEFWEPIKELEERRKGVAPAKVIPEKVETPHGVYAGGYYPVVTDIGSELRANQLEDAKSLKELADNSSVRAATRKGHTKERVKSHGMRLRLDVGVIADHIEQVVQDIAFDEPTRELYKILDDRELQLEMAKVLGNEKVQMLKTWMVDVARGTYGSEPGWQRRYAKILNWIRQNTTIFNMGYKLTTAIVQPLGVTQTMQQLGVAPVLSQSLSFWSRPLKWRSVSREVFEKSTFMRNRAKNFDRDLRDALNKMQKGHPWFDWHAKLKEEAFRHIGILDLAVTVPTWKTAYQHAIGNLEMNEQGAIDFADGVVRQTQSAGSIINLAQVQRGGAGMRLMTMFYSYFSSFYNMMAEQKRESVDQWNADQKAKAIAGATSAVILLNILPAILAELAVGRGPEEDEDWFLWFMKKNGGQLAGGLVGVRDLASATMTDFDYAPSPIVGAVDTITRTVGTAAGGEVPRVKDLVNSAGYLTGSPFAGREAWILYNNAFKLYEGEDLTAFEALMVQENRD